MTRGAKIVNEGRCAFLKSGLATGAGLTLGIYFPIADARKVQPGPGTVAERVSTPWAFEPNAFVHIGTDESVTVIVKHLEIGQGTYTGLPTLLAEELDASWSQVRVRAAPADATRYNNQFWGPTQATGAGEPATPVIAPAVANALHAAAGRRRYRLPVQITS